MTDPMSMSRLSYAHWPRWVKIAWCCTLPIGFALDLLVTMIVQFGLMIYLAIVCKPSVDT